MLRESVIEYTGIIKVFRDGDAEAFAKITLFFSQSDGAVKEHDQSDDQDKECRVDYKTHAGQKPGSHGDEERADLACGPWRGAESYQAKSTCHGYSGADISVYGHDHDADDRREDRQCSDERTAGAVFVFIYQSEEKAQEDGREDRQQERNNGD